MGKKNKLFRDRFSQNSPRGPLLAILSDVRTAGSPLKKDEPWLEFQSHLVASPPETALPRLRSRSRLARANSRVTDSEIGIMEQTSSKSCPAFAKPATNAQPVASPLTDCEPVGLRKVDAHRSHQHLHVVPHSPFRGRLSQQVRRVVGHHHATVAILEKPASQTANRRSVVQQGPRGHRAQTADEFRLQDVELPFRVFPAVGNLFLRRISVLRRTALDRVHDINVLALHLAGFDDASQQLTGGSHKRFPLNVLVRSGSLPKENQPRRRIPRSEYGLRATLGQNLAPCTDGDFRSQPLQLQDPLVSRQRRSVVAGDPVLRQWRGRRRGGTRAGGSPAGLTRLRRFGGSGRRRSGGRRRRFGSRRGSRRRLRSWRRRGSLLALTRRRTGARCRPAHRFGGGQCDPGQIDMPLAPGQFDDSRTVQTLQLLPQDLPQPFDFNTIHEFLAPLPDFCPSKICDFGYHFAANAVA